MGGRSSVRVEAAHPSAFGWLTEKSGYGPLEDARGLQAVRDGELLGLIVFDGFTETIAAIHAAFETPVAAGCLIRPAFAYAFRQLGRIALVTALESRNVRAVRLAKGVGFRETSRVVDGIAMGNDLLHLEMRRHECRVLQEAHQ